MHKKLIGTITFPKKMRMIRRIPRDVGLMGEVTLLLYTLTDCCAAFLLGTDKPPFINYGLFCC